MPYQPTWRALLVMVKIGKSLTRSDDPRSFMHTNQFTLAQQSGYDTVMFKERTTNTHSKRGDGFDVGWSEDTLSYDYTNSESMYMCFDTERCLPCYLIQYEQSQ